MLPRRVRSSAVALAVVLPLIAAAPASAQPVAPASHGRCQSQVDLTTPPSRQATLRDITLNGEAAAYDRVELLLNRPVSSIQAGYVPRYVQDGSGNIVRLRGAADFKLRLYSAVAHNEAGDSTVPAAHERQFRSWPSVREVRLADDFEGYVGVGVGLQQRVDFRVTLKTKPNRIVVDFAHPGKHPWNCNAGAVKLYLLNRTNFEKGVQPYLTPVWRRVKTPAVAGGALNSLFNGPTDYESAAGLDFVNSEALGFTNLSIVDGVARVRLTWGCDSGGSTFTIANEIRPTLKQFASVRWVKIYDPAGHTQRPTGKSDSIPECLEP